MFINDSIHGLLKLPEHILSLIHLPELQRLQWVKQLGLTFLCYPGAMHSRFSHSLGVSYVAGRIGAHLSFSEDEIKLITSAAFLHDVGHTPFSHALEPLLEEDHMEITADLITGKRVMDLNGAGQIPQKLMSHGIDPQKVADLVTCRYKERPAVQQVIFGDLDADQIDYLVRDSYFCGTSHGQVDIYRLIYTMALSADGQHTFMLDKGIEAVEEMLVGRDHMYSSVYTHKTCRIAEMMLLRACQSAIRDIPGFEHMIDSELMAALSKSNSFAKETLHRLVYRKLYKKAHALYFNNPGAKDVMQKVLEKFDEKSLEAEIAKRTGLPNDRIIADLPVSALELGEPRLKTINIRIITKSHEEKPLTEVSSLARALLNREATHMLLGIYCAPEHRSAVSTTCRELISEL